MLLEAAISHHYATSYALLIQWPYVHISSLAWGHAWKLVPVSPMMTANLWQVPDGLPRVLLPVQ